MRVGVLGLGEAGSLIAADLARAGDTVRGFDPSEVPTPQGVERHARAEDAVTGCDLVLAVTPGSQARRALEDVIDALDEKAIYADLSTASPVLKEDLAALVAGQGALFADVALMSPVPGHGLSAPALVSGSGATEFADLINGRGGQIEVVGARAGEAATRKLLRSVVMKGLAALLIESMEAGERAGKGEWLWGHLVSELTSLNTAMLRRLLLDTAPHAGRRLDEMRAAQDLLVELGVTAPMTTATIQHLERLLTGNPEGTLSSKAPEA
ncbi:MAG TPA: NAD(P)-binding domain-containing protein [Acidimicrobiia bacterium]|nr:NAD(P)-binding domain-containing protein [Acidimicrobiia bacterium]